MTRYATRRDGRGYDIDGASNAFHQHAFNLKKTIY